MGGKHTCHFLGPCGFKKPSFLNWSLLSPTLLELMWSKEQDRWPLLSQVLLSGGRTGGQTICASDITDQDVTG